MRFSLRSLAFLVGVGCAAPSVPMLASCQGNAVGPGGSGGSPGAGGGGSSTVIMFDAGGTAWTLPDGCAGPAASDAGYDGPTGCEGIEGGVTYPAVASILAGCQGEGCHDPPTHDTLVGQVAGECCDGRLLVSPGNAALSYLLDKVEGHDLCYPGRMPLNKTPLSDAETLTLRRWICEGAPGQ